MRKFSAVIIIFALLMLLADCSGTRLPKTDAVLTGKIIQLKDGGLLLTGDDAHDLFRISNIPDIYDSKDRIADTSDLKTGQIVEIGYSGMIMQSYPAQPGAPVYIKITGEGDDLVGFYQTVLNDLWEVDAGLNGDINVLAFDLSQVSNLTEAEKNALVYVVGNKHEVSGIRGTFDELYEQGYINKEKLYFEKGMLITLEVSDVTKNSFTFDVTKWRSGTGAFFFNDCKAVKTKDGWSYSVGGEAIS